MTDEISHGTATFTAQRSGEMVVMTFNIKPHPQVITVMMGREFAKLCGQLIVDKAELESVDIDDDELNEWLGEE